MHFQTTKQAWAALRAAKLRGGDFQLAPDYANGGGWRVEQHGGKPLTAAQRDKLEAFEHVAPPALKSAYTPVSKARDKGQGARATNDTATRTNASRAPRIAGATHICREIMSPAYVDDKAGFIAACAARGVIASTASTQWYRLRK